MKNRDYWKQRAKIAEHTSHSMSVDTTKRVLRSFNSAESNIQKEIEAWYQRYANNNEITLAEARKQISTKELAELKWDVEEYIKKGQENAVNGKWIKELENASARAHISRLEALQLRMRQQCEIAFADEETQTRSLLENVYKDGFYRSAYEIQKGLGAAFSIGALDNERVQKVISKPWTIDGATFSDRIWKHKTQLVSDLHTGIIQSFVRGEAPDWLINEISKKFNTTKYNAGRLIQTEQAFFYTQSQRDLYKDLDVEEYEIVATLDSKTSDICQDMDGKHFKMSEYEVGTTAPPFHVNCRSVFIPYYDDWDEFGVDVERAAREDGQTVHIGGNLTYEEWKKQYVTTDVVSGARDIVDINFNISISGLKKLENSKITSTGVKYGQELNIITVEKRNQTQWDELPTSAKEKLKYSKKNSKAYNIQKGDYEVQRYIEGSPENAERDEIAKAVGAKYLGFVFNSKDGVFIDFYRDKDSIFYSVGLADVKKNISEDALKKIKAFALDKENKIIESIGEKEIASITKRKGDDWVEAMRRFHRSVGADGLPEIIGEQEYEALGTTKIFRGIAPESNLRRDITTELSTKEMVDEFFKGKSPFPSRGVYGDGIAYGSPSYKKIAMNYATSGGEIPHGGVIIEFKLKPSARVIQYEDALELFQKLSKERDSKLLFNPEQTNARNKEVGKAMNALGYDAILKHNGDNTGEDFYVILNRGALVTKKNYITKIL